MFAKDLTCGTTLTPFEYAKLKSVKCMMKLYQLRGKAGETPERYLFGMAVSINILEAMMQDALLGCEDNAWAGYELMLEPGNLDRIFRGAGSGIDMEVYRGVPCLNNPLPVVWNNLYTTWNLGRNSIGLKVCAIKQTKRSRRAFLNGLMSQLLETPKKFILPAPKWHPKGPNNSHKKCTRWKNNC